MLDMIVAAPFAGFDEIRVSVNEQGDISMDRFGSWIQPEDAERIGLGLIQAAAVARERKNQVQSLEEDSSARIKWAHNGV